MRTNDDLKEARKETKKKIKLKSNKTKKRNKIIKILYSSAVNHVF